MPNRVDWIFIGKALAISLSNRVLFSLLNSSVGICHSTTFLAGILVITVLQILLIAGVYPSRAFLFRVQHRSNAYALNAAYVGGIVFQTTAVLLVWSLADKNVVNIC